MNHYNLKLILNTRYNIYKEYIILYLNEKIKSYD
jgi:hypothetical protein